jgi:hypothetical protein
VVYLHAHHASHVVLTVTKHNCRARGQRQTVSSGIAAPSNMGACTRTVSRTRITGTSVHALLVYVPNLDPSKGQMLLKL